MVSSWWSLRRPSGVRRGERRASRGGWSDCSSANVRREGPAWWGSTLWSLYDTNADRAVAGRVAPALWWLTDASRPADSAPFDAEVLVARRPPGSRTRLHRGSTGVVMEPTDRAPLSAGVPVPATS